MNNNINNLLNSLSKSKFRGSFHLNKKMKDYVKEKKDVDLLYRDRITDIIKDVYDNV